MNYRRELELAKQAAVLAGMAIMEIYNSDDFDVELKNDNSPLTKADKRANEIIVSMLKTEFHDYAILSEESEDDKSRLKNDYCFVVDPLDGTKEFIKRNGQFTVNIALAYKHKSVMGVIYVPVTKELYYAVDGFGAYYEIEGKEPVKLKVSDRTTDIRAVMSLSHGCVEMDELIKKHNIKNCVKIGSSLKGCLVAKGEAEVYYRFNPTREWDTAAMQCIAEEAGAIFRQMDGSQMRYNRENTCNDEGFFVINCEENRLG
ncbi:MAG: 3'(2'),5'-bisphosphate nucleotidase CysQ [Oscillospiraceae bacterium]|nr:3'(2'),5'-bisphosphate nucleotidase CysQ [Oscillospiraceae bacterium]